VTTIALELSQEDVRRIALEVAARLGGPREERGYLSVDSAATYCDMSADAIRAAERRGQLHGIRGETGRLRFAVGELDRFVGAG
jgi:hypothetical protein